MIALVQTNSLCDSVQLFLSIKNLKIGVNSKYVDFQYIIAMKLIQNLLFLVENILSN